MVLYLLLEVRNGMSKQELDFCKLSLSFRTDIVSVIVHHDDGDRDRDRPAMPPIHPPILFLVCVGCGGGESLVLRPQLMDGVAHRARALLVQLAVLGPELEVEHLQGRGRERVGGG